MNLLLICRFPFAFKQLSCLYFPISLFGCACGCQRFKFRYRKLVYLCLARGTLFLLRFLAPPAMLRLKRSRRTRSSSSSRRTRSRRTPREYAQQPSPQQSGRPPIIAAGAVPSAVSSLLCGQTSPNSRGAFVSESSSVSVKVEFDGVALHDNSAEGVRRLLGKIGPSVLEGYDSALTQFLGHDAWAEPVGAILKGLLSVADDD